MSILEKIKGMCSRHPGRTAFMNKEESITYGELWQRSDALADWIHNRLKDRSRPVIVYGHMQPDMIVCFLACVKAGKAYIPIDVSIPANRIENIVKASRADLFLSLGEPNQETANFNISILDHLGIKQAINRHLDAKPDISPEGIRHVTPEENFYIIYTSGSTGEPKGVQITTACLDSFVDWMESDFHFNEDDMILNQAPFSFDLSVMDLYPALIGGATIWALDKELIDSADEMFNRLHDSGLSVWVSTPSFAEYCLMNRLFDETLLPRLHTFLFCGEQLSVSMAQKLMRRFPRARVINTYGPTETTVAVTSILIDRNNHFEQPLLPIGYCKPGCRIVVVNPDGDIVPEGERGEIIILGKGVSKGYLGNRLLTEKAFYTVYDQDLGLVKAYRTGDIGYYKDGVLYCSGRGDSQIKYNGYRIELEEIQHQLIQIPDIRAASIVPLTKNGKCYMLSAVIVAEEEVNEDQLTKRIKEQLSITLPTYMIPQKYIYIDSFPLTVNGKMDQSKLKSFLLQDIAK